MAVPLPAELVVLAAGKSSRVGGLSKGLVPVEGRPWLDWQLDAVAGIAARVVLVLSPANLPFYLRALPRLEDRAAVVVNPDPSRGPFSSLQCGLMAVKSGSPVFALPVDVPAAGPEVWKRLMEALLSREKQETCAVHAAVPSREGRGGHPVLLAPAFVAHLLSLPPHEGRLDEAIARLERVARVPVTDERVQMNLNTAEDWRKLRARSHGTRAGDR